MPEVGFEIAKEAVDDRMKIQGLEARHANTSPVGRGIQLSALKDIWDDKSAPIVKQNLLKYIDNIRSRKVPDSDLLSRARLGKYLPSKRVLEALPITMKIDILDEDGKPTGEKEEVEATSKHYGYGATNLNAKPTSNDENSCYTNLSGDARGAAWHNIVLSNVEYPPLDKGDSFYTTFVNAGPTWIPSGGYVSFHDLDQISEYTIDIEKIIEKYVVGKLDHIMYGIGMSLDDLRPKEHKFMVADYFE